MDRHDVVENMATGERVRFMLTADDTGGELLVIEDHWTRPGHVVPRHVHPGMEERWTVIEGKIAYSVDGVETIAGPGDSVIAPAGTPHSARDAGNGEVVVRIVMRPALRWEDFVRQLFALAGEELEGDVAARSIAELFGEFQPEIELAPEDPHGQNA
ncbi:MAG: cupin domain-containing protein [Actinomycetota bacterium]|nr:cupin domain-containing protein [Actinomycetota bacterium]